MLETVKQFLINEGWKFSEVEKGNQILFGISGQNGNFQCFADILEKENRFIFFSICGSNAPVEKRKEILELINQLNYNTFLGNFEMDPEDGEIRFRTSIFFESIEPNLKLVEQIIIPNIIATDKSLPGIMGIIYGDLTPQQAFEKINSQKEDFS